MIHNFIKILVVLGLLFTLGSHLLAAETPGTWELFPLQAAIYTTQVEPPINADGTSNFQSKRGVVPVQFALSKSYGPVALSSLSSGGPAYSFLSFTPATPMTFNDLTNLSVVYAFTEGNCGGGSLRWSVRVSASQSIFIYYGAHPNFTDCSSTGASQSGINLLSLTDARFDTSQIGGTFYDTYAHARTLAGSMPVIRASLVMDSSWMLDQVAVISNATVNDNTFVPMSGGGTTCDLPTATIQLSRESGTATGVINEVSSVGPPDQGEHFRIVDCKYKYNLLVNQLEPGRYKVTALINGTDPAAGPAFFDLR